MVDFDDKDLAIIALLIIALAIIFGNVENAKDVIIAIVSAIAGFVSGRKSK